MIRALWVAPWLMLLAVLIFPETPNAAGVAPAVNSALGCTNSGDTYQYDGANMVCAPPLSLIIHARVTLSSAQILALATTPVQIVPAQGAGTIIELIGATVVYNFNTTAYAGGGNVGFAFAPNPAVRLSSQAATVFTNASISTIAFFPGASGIPTLSSVTNQALVFSAATAFTTGNGTADVDVWYTVGTP